MTEVVRIADETQKPAVDPKTEFAGYLKERFNAFSSRIGEQLEQHAGEEIVRLSWTLKGEGKKTFILKVPENQPSTTEVNLQAELNGKTATVNLSSFFWYNGGDRGQKGFQFKVDGDKTIVVNLFRRSHLQLKNTENAGIELAHHPDDPLIIRMKGLPDCGEFARSYFANEGGPSAFYDHITPHKNQSEIYMADTIGLTYQGGKSWCFNPVKFDARKREEAEYELSFSFGEQEGLTFEQLLVRLFLINLAVRIPLLLYGRAGLKCEKALKEFLRPSDFSMPRPVNFNTYEVSEHFRSKGLNFPWHVLDAACTSLNAGKHVIFTGPPGCGKSTLAVELASFYGEKENLPLVATASPEWSTADLIGRYLPRRNAFGLRFEPGLFLRAIDDGRWLVIDELNRANIDRAFGELFSVLADDMVELPLREVVRSDDSAEGEDEIAEADQGDGTEDDGSAMVETARTVRIVPFDKTDAANASSGQFRDYYVPQAFRILATMNDADRSRLHQLSFALQRRFNIIRVDAPDRTWVEPFIQDTIQNYAQKYQLIKDDKQNYCYRIRLPKGKRGCFIDLCKPGETGTVAEVLSNLFSSTQELGSEDDTSERKFGDLISERVVGMATIHDIIRFVAEGLRAPIPVQAGENHVLRQLVFSQERWNAIEQNLKKGDKLASAQVVAEQFMQSYIALGVSLMVVPQLEALSGDERLFRAIRVCLQAFDATAKFWRVTALSPAIKEGEGDNQVEYTLTYDPEQTITDYLAGQIVLQLGRENRSMYQQEWENLRDEGLISRLPW